MQMSKLRDDIVEFEQRMGERVEAVAIGRVREQGDFDRHEPVTPIGREEAMARPEFDREYDPSMGSVVQPNSIYAWTASWVLFLSGEAGGAGPTWVPRHPVPCTPELGGNDEWS